MMTYSMLLRRTKRLSIVRRVRKFIAYWAMVVMWHTTDTPKMPAYVPFANYPPLDVRLLAMSIEAPEPIYRRMFDYRATWCVIWMSIVLVVGFALGIGLGLV